MRTAARNPYYENITGYFRPDAGTNLDAIVNGLYGLELPDDGSSEGLVIVWDRDAAVLDRAILAFDVTLSTIETGEPWVNTRYTIPVAELGRSEGRWAGYLPTSLPFDFWVVTLTAVYQDGHSGPKRTVNCYMPRQTEFYTCDT